MLQNILLGTQFLLTGMLAIAGMILLIYANQNGWPSSLFLGGMLASCGGILGFLMSLVDLNEDLRMTRNTKIRY
jgi:hypothetical protein